eukprot:295681_1
MGLTYSQSVFIAYGALYFIGAMIATIYSYIDSRKQYEGGESMKKKVILFWQSIWSKKKMYGPMIVHIFDTASDAGVLVEWYLLAKRERNDPDFNVPHLDMSIMFWCNLGSILLYRFISTVWIYRLTQSITQSILQLFDLLLFKAIYVCWKLKRKEPSNPQQYLQKLEGVFESTPQALLQLIYSIRLKSFSSSSLVTISFFFSLISLSMRSVSDDKLLFKETAKELNLDISKCKLSFSYIRRVIFRIIDVSHRILLLSLVWIVIGGFAFSMLLIIECIPLVFYTIKSRNILVLQGIVTLVLEFSTLTTFSVYWTNFRLYIENATLITIITLFLFIDVMDCNKCVSVDQRKEFILEDSFGFTVYIITFILIVLLPVTFYMSVGDFYERHNICCCTNCWCKSNVYCDCFTPGCSGWCVEEEITKEEFKQRNIKNANMIKTTSRDIGEVLRSGDLQGFEELLVFGANVRSYYDSKMRYRLLHIVCILYNNIDKLENINVNQVNKIVDRLIGLRCPIKPKQGGSMYANRQNVFQFACAYGALYVAQQVYEHYDVQLEKQDQNERTAAFLAVMGGNKELFEWLKTKGAVCENIKDTYGTTIEEMTAQNDAVGWDLSELGGLKKMLILGTGAVGGSTLFKQIRLLYGDGFVEKDKLQFKDHIYAQIVEQTRLMFEMMEIYNETDEETENLNKHFDTYEYKEFLGKHEQDIEFIQSRRPTLKVTEEVANVISSIWSSSFFKRQMKYSVENIFADDWSNSYFLDKVHEVGRSDYVPTEMDILYVYHRTTGVIEQRTSINGLIYHIFDLGKQKSERKKWIHCFESVNVVTYQASLAHLNTFMFEDEEKNAMVDNINLWKEIVNNEWFKETVFVLIFTHWDIYEEMSISDIEKAPIFADYEGKKTKQDYYEYLKHLY